MPICIEFKFGGLLHQTPPAFHPSIEPSTQKVQDLGDHK
jgi:hypothetical protein